MITAIDHAHLHAQTFGDPELAHELLGLFAEQCRRILPDLIDPARTPQERADLAHTLKGSAVGVGAGRIAALGEEAEALFRRGGEPEPPMLADLRAAVETALTEIERWERHPREAPLP